ncbi:MAG: DUF1449 family protein [Polyangiaceae bacterium]|jgi:hypothetical protein
MSALLVFPTAVWTVLVAISLVYWIFVMSGLVHLGEGVDGGADGAAEGTAGAIKGALEGAGGHGPELDADADIDGPDADLDVDGDGGPLHGFLAAFRMRDVPVTVSFSLVSFFAWVACLVGFWGASKAGVELATWVKAVLAFGVAPLLAWPLAKLATLPLAPLLTTKKAKSAKDLVGKTCTIRTGTADHAFGEAVVKDTGADLVLRVRVEGGALKRGEEGLIVGFDEEREEYVVASMDEAMGRRKSS